MKYLISIYLLIGSAIAHSSFVRNPFRRSPKLITLIKVDDGEPRFTQVMMDDTLFYIDRKRLLIQNRDDGRIIKLTSSPVKKIARFKNIVLVLNGHQTLTFWYRSADGTWAKGEFPASDRKLTLNDDWFHSYINFGKASASVEPISDFLVSQDAVVALGKNGKVYTYINLGAVVRSRPVEAWHIVGRYGVQIRSAVPVYADGRDGILTPKDFVQIVSLARVNDGFALFRKDQQVEILNDKAEHCQAVLNPI